MIEDVQYLQQHCEVDSTVVYVDSDLRDRNYFPYPAEYTVTFDQPFKLIVGFDVLDASIPTTMWNVDRYNGTLALTLVSGPSSSPQSKIEIVEKFKDIKDIKNFNRLYQRNHLPNQLAENFVIVINDDYYWRNEIQPNIDFTSIQETSPYFVYILNSARAPNIKLAPVNLDKNSYFTFTYLNELYYSESDDPDLRNLVEANNFILKISQISGNFDIYYYEEYQIDQATYTSILQAKRYTLHIGNYYKQIELGNYDITSLKVQLNTVWNPTTIEFETTVSPDNKQGIYKIQSATGLVIVNATIGKLIKQLGFDTYPRRDENTRYRVDTVGSNQRSFFGLYNQDLRGYIVTAPGIVNLLGDRFVIVKCKEIEDHLLGSYGYTQQSPGIGLFKLAASYNDVTHLRFDFVNLVRKPFHPIGKLSKLSVRFETPEGNLYDFKGINHQILFLFKFLVPTQKNKIPKPILNPNYDPNFMNYMSSSKHIEYKDDSDNEQDFNTKEYQEKYKKEMVKYDYSTTDDDEHDSETDDDSEIEFDFSGRKRLP